MSEDDLSSIPPPGRPGAGLPLYILAAAVAAIAGFAAMWLARPEPPAVRVVASPQNAATASPSPQAEKGHGLERLVRVDPANPLGEVAFADGEGKQRTLSEWRGKVVLINLWATWCAPCKVEMPSLARLQAKLGGSNFVVLPISLDRTGPDKPRAFLASEELQALGLYMDSQNALMQTLRAPGLPLSVLVDGEGREIARLAGPAEWDSAEAEAIIRDAIAAKETR
jgi:thiol-disulfide isomerase/thioredoxin